MWGGLRRGLRGYLDYYRGASTGVSHVGSVGGDRLIWINLVKVRVRFKKVQEGDRVTGGRCKDMYGGGYKNLSR